MNVITGILRRRFQGHKLACNLSDRLPALDVRVRCQWLYQNRRLEEQETTRIGFWEGWAHGLYLLLYTSLENGVVLQYYYILLLCLLNFAWVKCCWEPWHRDVLFLWKSVSSLKVLLTCHSVEGAIIQSQPSHHRPVHELPGLPEILGFFWKKSPFSVDHRRHTLAQMSWLVGKQSDAPYTTSAFPISDKMVATRIWRLQYPMEILKVCHNSVVLK